MTSRREGVEAQPGAQAEGECVGGGGSADARLKKDSGLPGRGRGRLTSPDDR